MREKALRLIPIDIGIGAVFPNYIQFFNVWIDPESLEDIMTSYLPRSVKHRPLLVGYYDDEPLTVLAVAIVLLRLRNKLFDPAIAAAIHDVILTGAGREDLEIKALYCFKQNIEIKTKTGYIAALLTGHQVGKLSLEEIEQQWAQ